MGLGERVAMNGSRDNQRFKWVMGLAKTHYFGSKSTALEIGPGDGTFARGIKAVGYELVSFGGPDPGGNWDHFELDIQRESLPGAFDFIHLGQVLEHLEDDKAALINVLKMATAGSLIVITVPNFKDPEHRRTYTQASFHDLVLPVIDVREMRTFRGNGYTCWGVAGFRRLNDGL